MAFNQEAQHLLHWAESINLSLVPQFIMGAQNVVTDSLNCSHRVLGLEWTLAQEVVNELVARWPVTVDLFTTALNYRLLVYFSPPLQSHGSGHRCLSSGLGWIAGVCFPTFCADPSVPDQADVVHRDVSHPLRFLLAPEGVVSCATEPGGGSSGPSAHTSRLNQTASLRLSAPEPPHAEPSCMETVQWFTPRAVSMCGTSALCVGVSPLTAFTSFGGNVTVLGDLDGGIPSPLRLLPRLPTSSCIFVRSDTCPWWRSRVTIRPWSPSSSFVCRSCLTALSFEISSAPLRSSVPVVRSALPRGTL